jgi:adenosylmethionine-8-amino-7-oxononanoate aminotransferase
MPADTSCSTAIQSTSFVRVQSAAELKSRLYKFFLERGVLLRPLGHVIYILPPYSISREELDYVYEVIEEALETIS